MATTQKSRSDLKVCFKCLASKPLDEFYAHPMMADGRLGKCKECAKADVRKNRRDNLSYYTAYDKERDTLVCRVEMKKRYAKTKGGKVVLRRLHQKWIANNPEKRAAQVALGNAVRDGRILRLPCERCGSKVVHGHHENYSKPLDVMWLCPKHHSERHRELKATT